MKYSTVMELFSLFWIALTLSWSLPMFYWYLTRNFKFWKNRGVFGPKPLPYFGHSLNIFLTPLPISEMNWLKKYGRIYGTYKKQTPSLTVAEPEIIKSIMVKDFHMFSDRSARPNTHPILKNNLFELTGNNWKRLRSIMSPNFTSNKMKNIYSTIRKCLNDFLNSLEVSAKNRDTINLKDAHGNFTIDVIASCAFATKTNSHSDPNNLFIKNGRKVLAFTFWRIFFLIVLPKPLLKMLGIESRYDESGSQFLVDLIRNKIFQRKSDPNSFIKCNDFIQILANAVKDKDDLDDTNDVDEAHHLNEGEEELEIKRSTYSINIVNKQLTEEEIIAQGWLFFMAGYDTVASTLAFCSYELALNPQIQDKLYDELLSAMDAQSEISYEELARLPYLDAVISESLRMYPPVLRLERKALGDYRLGNTGLIVNKGQSIEIPVYGIHHSKEFYPNPERFNPNRFLPENRINLIPYTYLPFGSGPRGCIGMRFALMEIKLCLAHIIKQFRFFRSEQTAVPLEFKTLTNISNSKNLLVGIENRKKI